MEGAEQAVMAAVFACFALWFSLGRNWIWLGVAALSQVPFWIGWGAYLSIGDWTPAGINMCSNLMVAALFVEWGHKLQSQGRGGVIHIWLSVVFLSAASMDVVQLLYLVPHYILAQELIHYLALIIIGGRAYVRGFDGAHRSFRDRSRAKSSGGMV